MHFIDKTTCNQKLGPGGLIDPLGAKDVKCGGWEFSRKLNSPTPPSVNSHPGLLVFQIIGQCCLKLK